MSKNLLNNTYHLIFSYLIRLGSSKVNHDDETLVQLEALAFIKHPLYKKGQEGLYFDVGVVVTKTPIQFNNFVRPVCLPALPADTLDFLTGHLVTMAGWGLYHVDRGNRVPSKSLKFFSLKVS